MYELFETVQKRKFHSTPIICSYPLFSYRSTSGRGNLRCTKTCMSSRILQHQNT